jgi:heme/copper-type cytochrome/quinol oxidase subunit 2
MRFLVPVVVVLVTACGGDTQAPTTTDATTTTTSTTTATTAPEAETTTTTPAADTTTTTEAIDPYTFDIVIEGSTVTGGGRISVPLGETVTLRFTSDRADEIHIHGYDLTVDLEPGMTTEISFLADIPGIVEIETHSNHQVVANLESS